jgi:hypothetical protein
LHNDKTKILYKGHSYKGEVTALLQDIRLLQYKHRIKGITGQVADEKVIHSFTMYCNNIERNLRSISVIQPLPREWILGS